MKNNNFVNLEITVPAHLTAAAVVKAAGRSAVARQDGAAAHAARETLRNLSAVETVEPSAVDVVPRAPYVVPRLTFSAAVVPSAYRAAAAAVERCRVGEFVVDHAARIARGVLRALCVKSGMSSSGKRPTVARDSSGPVWAMRRELTAHLGRPGGDNYTPAAAYWCKVAAAVERETAAERAEREHMDAAAALRAAAAAAKRAGDMETYTETAAAARRETAAARAAGAAAARREAWEQVDGYTVGRGVDLYQIAAAYLWERLAVDGLPVWALCRGRASNGRESVRSVGQWAAILCRRAVRAEGAAMEQTAAGYTYFAEEYMEQTALEDVGGQVVRRAPHYYDMTPTEDTETPAENLETMERLTAAVGFSRQQLAILTYRLQGFSRADIAAAMGTTESNVKNQLRKMREKCEKSGVFAPEKLEKMKSAVSE